MGEFKLTTDDCDVCFQPAPDLAVLEVPCDICRFGVECEDVREPGDRDGNDTLSGKMINLSSLSQSHSHSHTLKFYFSHWSQGTYTTPKAKIPVTAIF